MADFVFKLSPNIILGNYSLAGIGEEASKFGNNFMFIVDPFFKNLDLIEKIKASLQEKNISLFLFDGFWKTPDSDVIERALTLARGARIHGVITCGDITACAIGRAIASLYNEKDSIYNHLEGEPITAEPLPLIQIPTTCNDPFLLGKTSFTADSRNRTIRLLKVQEELCKLVIIDPRVYSDLAPNETIAMIFVGITMAFEGYTSTKSNFFSETILGKSISLFLTALDSQYEKLNSLPKEEVIAHAVCLAAMGISAAAPGLGTAIAISTAAKHKISASLVSTILLPHIIKDAIPSSLTKTAIMAKMLGETIPKGSDTAEISIRGIEEIRRQIAEANLPSRLKDLDLDLESFISVAEDASKLSFMNYNPHPMSNHDIFEIVKQAF